MEESETLTAQAPAWLPGQLQFAWDFLAAYPPVLALAVALIGIGLSLVGRGLVLFWGRKLGSRIRGELHHRLLRIAANVAAMLVAYLSVVLAVQLIGLSERVEQIIIRILLSFLILRLMVAAMRAGHIGLEIAARLRKRFAFVEERTLSLFDLLLTVIVVGAVAYALLMVWNIDPTAWLASAGVIGIAVAFAARDTLANLFAGFFIIADAPYKIGDYVVLDTGERGEVTKVGIRSTRILTRDDVEITVPNSTMANSQIYNESGGKWERFRIRIKVGVAYGSDVDRSGRAARKSRLRARHGLQGSDTARSHARLRRFEPGFRAAVLGRTPGRARQGCPRALHGDLQGAQRSRHRDPLSAARRVDAQCRGK